MTPFTELLQQGTAHAWLFIPTAILLGILHGLEPGHSKTMMAAFIIAIRGTVSQAILLGVTAAISHTAVVWAVALGGMYFGQNLNAETSEPYFLLASAAIVVGIAVWMFWRTWREQRAEQETGHHHGEEVRHINTGHGVLAVEVFEDGVPPRWRIRFERGERFDAKDVIVETLRPDGKTQVFTFKDKGDYLESKDEIPEPHEFKATLRLGHGNHTHDYEMAFAEHSHSHMNLGDEDDAHARAHASDIRRRFEGRTVTTGQIMLFGLTGGLLPCPAAITVLLLCLQLKQITLGATLVLCFSVGLALTMVLAGVLAAISVNHVSKRWSGFSTFARRAPYASGVLMLVIAAYMAYSGFNALGVH